MADASTQDAPVRENILKLAQMITGRIIPITPKHIEYRVMDKIATDEMAEVALKMELRKPKKFDEIQKLTGLEPEKLKQILKDLLMAGICEFSYENPEHERQYWVDIPVSGSSELSITNKEQYEKYPEVVEYFERCSLEPLAPLAAMAPPGGGGIGMHVIPLEQAIDHESRAVDVEHISYWMKKYNKFALWPCQCRLARKKEGLDTGDDPEEWCIAIGDFADFIVETKRGRYADYDEVLEVLRKADDNGFVHQVTNIDGPDKVFIICNCNVNDCFALRTSQFYNAPNLSRSSFVASVNPEKCVACGRCVEKCPAGAVKLGQKLCTKDGPMTYPVHDLPDDLDWGPERWDKDFRDHNRINCYPTGTAPCKTACPAHIAIQGYLKLASQGKYDEALALIKRNNPFPAVCGRVCNRRCEEACTRGTIDRPVAIDEVKNFLAQRDLDAATRYIPPRVIPKVNGDFSEKIAVIGAGPAGLSCAFYLALKGYHPTVFEQRKKPGGMLVYGIPSFKLEKDVVAAEIEVMKAVGVEIRCGVEVGKDVTIAELRRQGYKAFYVAIGCQGSSRASVPGEDAEGVLSAVDFLGKVGENEQLRMEGRTVVIGGGNVAVDVARTAHRCGSEQVTMYCLEQRDAMPATEEEVLDTLDEGIQLENGWGPKEILTDPAGRVTGIVLKRCTQVRNAEGRFDPKYDENDTIQVACDHVILSIGQKIVWGHLLDGTAVTFGRGNGPVANPKNYQTAEKDIFVGGDVYTGPKFVIDAIAAGRMASEVIHRYVRGAQLDLGRDLQEFIELDKKNIVLDEDQYDRPARQQHGYRTGIDRKNSFRDPRLPFTEEQVHLETSRCLGCGAAVVDQNKCIGCGVCTNRCAFGAITISRERPECTHMIKAEEQMPYILDYEKKRQQKIMIRKAKEAEYTTYQV